MACTEEHRDNRYRLLFYRGMVTADTREDAEVSIQIVDAANPAARAELRERLSGLYARFAQFGTAVGDESENKEECRQRMEEEAKALYHALTGYQPTAEELGEMFKV